MKKLIQTSLILFTCSLSSFGFAGSKECEIEGAAHYAACLVNECGRVDDFEACAGSCNKEANDIEDACNNPPPTH